ncbi:hypothetical protein HDU96_000982, partial [Phlyctochytrium bullatum]
DDDRLGSSSSDEAPAPRRSERIKKLQAEKASKNTISTRPTAVSRRTQRNSPAVEATTVVPKPHGWGKVPSDVLSKLFEQDETETTGEEAVAAKGDEGVKCSTPTTPANETSGLNALAALADDILAGNDGIEEQQQALSGCATSSSLPPPTAATTDSSDDELELAAAAFENDVAIKHTVPVPDAPPPTTAPPPASTQQQQAASAFDEWADGIDEAARAAEQLALLSAAAPPPPPPPSKPPTVDKCSGKRTIAAPRSRRGATTTNQAPAVTVAEVPPSSTSPAVVTPPPTRPKPPPIKLSLKLKTRFREKVAAAAPPPAATNPSATAPTESTSTSELSPAAKDTVWDFTELDEELNKIDFSKSVDVNVTPLLLHLTQPLQPNHPTLPPTPIISTPTTVPPSSSELNVTTGAPPAATTKPSGPAPTESISTSAVVPAAKDTVWDFTELDEELSKIDFSKSASTAVPPASPELGLPPKPSSEAGAPTPVSHRTRSRTKPALVKPTPRASTKSKPKPAAPAPSSSSEPTPMQGVVATATSAADDDDAWMEDAEEERVAIECGDAYVVPSGPIPMQEVVVTPAPVFEDSDAWMDDVEEEREAIEVANRNPSTATSTLRRRPSSTIAAEHYLQTRNSFPESVRRPRHALGGFENCGLRQVGTRSGERRGQFVAASAPDHHSQTQNGFPDPVRRLRHAFGGGSKPTCYDKWVQGRASHLNAASTSKHHPQTRNSFPDPLRPLRHAFEGGRNPEVTTNDPKVLPQAPSPPVRPRKCRRAPSSDPRKPPRPVQPHPARFWGGPKRIGYDKWVQGRRSHSSAAVAVPVPPTTILRPPNGFPTRIGSLRHAFWDVQNLPALPPQAPSLPVVTASSAKHQFSDPQQLPRPGPAAGDRILRGPKTSGLRQLAAKGGHMS